MFISRTKTIIESVLQVAINSKVFLVIFSNTQIAHYLQNLKQDTTDIYLVDTKGIGSYHPICQNWILQTWDTQDDKMSIFIVLHLHVMMKMLVSIF